MGVRLNQEWRLKVLRNSLARQTPASLASDTTPDDSAFVPRLISLLFGGDVETAVVMAVRRKLGYIEPSSEQSEALQGIVRVNWEVIRLCYKAGYQSLACLSASIVCAYTRNMYCACNFHSLHVTQWCIQDFRQVGAQLRAFKVQSSKFKVYCFARQGYHTKIIIKLNAI